MALFESYDRRIDHINAVLKEYGINGIEDAKAICDAKGIDPYTMCKETQPICFENACWAYVVGAAIAIKKGCTNAAEAAEAIGIGLQAFCIAGSVADDRKDGISTNPTRFQHPVAGTYKKECMENGHPYFSVASGGGTGRTLHPDNMAAGPASYGMTDTMGRMHGDAQFAGSSSVPAHVEMMGFLGMGNNPMVGATVAVAVAIEEAMKK